MKETQQANLDLPTVRARLAGLQGQQFWRGLEELAETDGFQELLQREFPRQVTGWMGPVSRRNFLKLMSASLALAGLSGCAPRPAEKIVPYVRAPEEIVPGKPLFYATALNMGGSAIGVLVESHMGRPTKIEGNPRHPASLGATDAFEQSAVLQLYDPDRSQFVRTVNRPSTWDSFIGAVTTHLQAKRGNQGAGLRVLTETVISPTLASQLQALTTEFPAARWHQYDPVGRDNALEGNRLAFGQDVNTIYRFDRARRILALDADFLMHYPGNLRYAREFIDQRRVTEGQKDMNRLYVVESTPTITGAMADHRLALRAGEVESFARALARELGVAGAEEGEIPHGVPADWLPALARDLQQHRSASVVMAGYTQPPSVHALAHALNQALDNVGNTVVYTEPVEANPVNQTQSLQELVRDIDAGQVDTLFIIGGNPVFNAPADLDFERRLTDLSRKQGGFTVHLSLYDDETSQLCHWHIPAAHDLEAWSDLRAFDGTVSIVQPLIEPLYGGKSAHELLAVLLGQPGRSSYEVVRDYWKGENLADDRAWRVALHDGVIADSALPTTQVSLRPDFAAQPTPRPEAHAAGDQDVEIIFRPDPTIWDGRFANNGWLQELPKPLTLLTWDNVALMSARTAIQQLGITVADPNQLNEEDLEALSRANGQLVELRYRERVVQAPVWIMPGHPDNSVTVHLGYGRQRAGKIGTGLGFNVYPLRFSDAPWFSSGLALRATGNQYPLATTQLHHSMEGRHLVRVATLDEYLAHPDFVQAYEHAGPATEEPAQHAPALHQPPSLYPEYDYSKGYRWGMAIDLNACIGCNACTIACQAENNIPIVGKTDVIRGREMHWLRVDRYYEGSLDNPATYFEPMLCQHCEKAPCEPVCPVEATSHSAEGLNEMTYNRCIGTRYCSNNCPYKVRRFNYLQYSKGEGEGLSLQLIANPDVTVRERGVMEKCTYCVQRINVGRIEAKKENREIRDGEVKTACQEVCPTRAIVFGNMNDVNSQVRKLKEQQHNYTLLTELGTQPRTTYLGRLRNPNPEIKSQESQQTGTPQH